MTLSIPRRGLIAGALAAAPPHDSPALDFPVASGSNLNTHEEILYKRDGDHHHHGAPLPELNETEVEMTHQKTPPSYYWSDIMDSQGEKRYPGLMAVHVLSMGFAFFGALPAGESPFPAESLTRLPYSGHLPVPVPVPRHCSALCQVSMASRHGDPLLHVRDDRCRREHALPQADP